MGFSEKSRSALTSRMVCRAEPHFSRHSAINKNSKKIGFFKDRPQISTKKYF
jgi:hypothetical protein